MVWTRDKQQIFRAKLSLRLNIVRPNIRLRFAPCIQLQLFSEILHSVYDQHLYTSDRGSATGRYYLGTVGISIIYAAMAENIGF
jgi:hypothetical protein